MHQEWKIVWAMWSFCAVVCLATFGIVQATEPAHVPVKQEVVK